MMNRDKIALYRLAYKRAGADEDAAADAAAYKAANKARKAQIDQLGEQIAAEDMNNPSSTYWSRLGGTASALGSRLKPAFKNTNLLWSLPVGAGVGALSWLFGSRPSRALAHGIGAAGLTAAGIAGKNSMGRGANGTGFGTQDIWALHRAREKHLKAFRKQLETSDAEIDQKFDTEAEHQ